MFKRYRNFLIIILSDIFLICLSLYLSFMFRYDSFANIHDKTILYWLVPCAVIFKIMFFYYFDLYQGMWRYTSTKDLLNIFKACFMSTMALILFVLFKTKFRFISRTVFVADFFMTMVFVSSVRISVRFLFHYFGEGKSLKEILRQIFSSQENIKKNKRAIIIGAGDCGEKIYREIRDNLSIKYDVIGFLDDNPAKTGRKIHGLTVFGSSYEIKKYVDKASVEEIIIAIPSAKSSHIRKIVDLCKQTKADYKIVPGMGELINGRVSVDSIRNVEYRDLLGREPVKLDRDMIGRFLNGKIVLVTGAAGSIGSGLCRQILNHSPEKIILFERAESPLYEIDLELKRLYPDIKIIPFLGDIQKKSDLEILFSLYRPQIVFHAAAYKHVPMLEKYPSKAVNNNILGTKNIVETSVSYNCEKFIFVSTDKAVNPANIMGASKRVCEMIVQNKNRSNNSGTSFITVRFGNVIGSVGSVIPLFKNQIRQGGPVTVTHPEVIRYFMLIPEACQLILQAAGMGKGGEIFVLDMGEPVKIDEMARDLIRFSGFEPDKDIKIEYVGLRPGEKLYEELLTEGEDVIPTAHKKIMVLGSRECVLETIEEQIKELEISARYYKDEKIKELLKKLVPEYVSASNT